MPFLKQVAKISQLIHALKLFFLPILTQRCYGSEVNHTVDVLSDLNSTEGDLIAIS